ncbi:MAG: PDZ domain-containing protein [Aquificaceae bacterium]
MINALISLLFALNFALLVSLFFLSGLRSFSAPLLERKTPDVSVANQRFAEVFKKEEKPQERLPTIKVLAIASGGKSMALALVDGQPSLLKVGSSVGPLSVVSIERNSILLSKDGQTQIVSLSLDKAQQAQGQLPQEIAKDSRVLQSKIPRSELERITSDPGLMFRQIRLVPFVQDGRTRGFLFEWIEPGSLFDRAGLLQGDVLVSINGQEIKSGEDAFRILQVLRNEQALRISLIRSQQQTEIQLRVE